MEFVWVLTVCGGLTGWGCGQTMNTPMPSFEACTAAVESFRLMPTVGENTSGDDGNSGFAMCQIYRAAVAPDHPTSWRISE